MLHVTLVDAADGEAASTDIVIGYKVSIDLVAHVQLQLVGHAARDDQSVTTLAGAERRQFAFLQAAYNQTRFLAPSQVLSDLIFK